MHSQRAALFVYFHTRQTRVRIVRARPRELPFGSLTLIAHSRRSGRMQIARRVLSLRRFIVWLMYASAPLRSQPVSTGRAFCAEADCGDRPSWLLGSRSSHFVRSRQPVCYFAVYRLLVLRVGPNKFKLACLLDLE
jgi:hypothetical protein